MGKQEVERRGRTVFMELHETEVPSIALVPGQGSCKKGGFPSKYTQPEDWQFGPLWKNVDPWILVISQENLPDVSRMVENGHSGPMMRQQTDPLPGTSSRS